MIVTVSTVKDSVTNLQRFVERNLAGGVDHLVVFLDEPDAAAEGYLAGHPHVTHVVTDEAYWRGPRPDSLNVRQVTNSNVVHALLAPFGRHAADGWVDWLFHLDADEVVQIDRERLLAEVPLSEPFVVLQSVEAVSKLQWDGEVTAFKRLLEPAELELLVALDVIPTADNREYFRGHTHGKLGVRPGLERRLQLHRVVAEDLTPLPPYDADWLQVLHYESYDGEEFVRKWMAHVSAGELRFRENRDRLKTALTALVANRSLTEELRQQYLMRLYHRWVEDDVTTLGDLGYLVAPQQRPARTPEPFPPGAQEAMRTLLATLVAADKRGASPAYKNKHLLELMRSVKGDLPGPLAEKVTAEVRRARAHRDQAPAAAKPSSEPSQPAGERRLGGLASRFGSRRP